MADFLIAVGAGVVGFLVVTIVVLILEMIFGPLGPWKW